MMKTDNLYKMKFLGASAFLFALLIIMPGSSMSSPAVNLTDDAEVYDISSYMEIAEDKGSEWKIEDIASKDKAGSFTAIKENSSYGKFTDSAMWLRFDLAAAPSARDGRWFLCIHMPLLDMVELYIPDGGGRYSVKRSGRLIPLYDKEVKGRNHTFEMPVSVDRKETFYIRIVTESLVVVPASIMSEDALYRADNVDRLIAGIYCGVILVMGLYNLCLFFSLKERTYLVYVAHIVFTGLYIISITGIGYEYLWPEMIWLNQLSDMFFGGLGLAFVVMFTRSFLDTHAVLQRIDVVLRVIVFLGFLIGFTSPFIGYSLSVKLITVLAAAAVVSCELAAIIALRQGYSAARFFLLAWTFFMAGVLGLVLANWSVIPFRQVPNLFMISSIMEITLMSFALADRINILREENQIAQAKVVHTGQLASLGELAAGVGHEINNPLQCIMNYSSIICRSLEDDDEKKEYMDIILGESRRIAAIVSGLLHLSRPASDDMVKVDVKTLVSEILALSKTQIKKDGIAVTVDIPDGLPLVKGHSQQLEQVILNFISNSRYSLNDKYSIDDKGKLITITAENYKSKDGPFVRIKVGDNGGGMAASIKEKVVTPFFTTKPPGSGTGLGLSISHDIINKHNGVMHIESVEGEYCTAIFDLPATDGGAVA